MEALNSKTYHVAVYLRLSREDCGRRRKNLYEDFKDGILTKEEYAMLREQY